MDDMIEAVHDDPTVAIVDVWLDLAVPDAALEDFRRFVMDLRARWSSFVHDGPEPGGRRASLTFGASKSRRDLTHVVTALRGHPAVRRVDVVRDGFGAAAG